jgi:hypothetical protein
MGGAALDLRHAEIDGGEIVINAVSIMGGIEVVAPEGVDVELSGFALMGGNSGPKDAGPVPAGAPIVRVRAYSLMGGVGVSRKRQRRSSHAHLHH